MKHEIKADYFGPKNETGGLIPGCSCGWAGTPVYRWQDYMHTLAKDQWSKHLKESAAEVLRHE